MKVQKIEEIVKFLLPAFVGIVITLLLHAFKAMYPVLLDWEALINSVSSIVLATIVAYYSYFFGLRSWMNQKQYQHFHDRYVISGWGFLLESLRSVSSALDVMNQYVSRASYSGFSTQLPKANKPNYSDTQLHRVVSFFEDIDDRIAVSAEIDRIFFTVSSLMALIETRLENGNQLSLERAGKEIDILSTALRITVNFVEHYVDMVNVRAPKSLKDVYDDIELSNQLVDLMETLKGFPTLIRVKEIVDDEMNKNV